uniref:Uncharacterized protein n=1 Tax=Arundo donax TaxID=35708 RepID=A0A0A8Z248_ARUDO
MISELLSESFRLHTGTYRNFRAYCQNFRWC